VISFIAEEYEVIVKQEDDKVLIQINIQKSLSKCSGFQTSYNGALSSANASLNTLFLNFVYANM
jgi:hypothetical protein